MHILQSFCIAMFSVLFRHNKTPKVFCLTFGVHVKALGLFFSSNIALMVWWKFGWRGRPWPREREGPIACDGRDEVGTCSDEARPNLHHTIILLLLHWSKDDLEEVVLCEDCLHQSLHILCSHVVQCCLILLVIVDAKLLVELESALPV